MILEAATSAELEINPWESAAHRFDEAAALLKLDDGARKVLHSLHGTDRSHSRCA